MWSGTLNSISLCDGESAMLDATQPFDAIYEWNTGSASPSIQIIAPGSYSVSIITECYATESSVQVTHSADCNPQIFIPNVFSPNGDNINDVWEVHINPAMDVIKVECSVFDRWGNTIFTSTSGQIQWDGTYKGEVMMSGVYVYVVRLVGDNDVQTLSGSVTIAR